MFKINKALIVLDENIMCNRLNYKSYIILFLNVIKNYLDLKIMMIINDKFNSYLGTIIYKKN